MKLNAVFSMTELGYFTLYMLPFTLPWAIVKIKISTFHPEQPNWDPNLQFTPLRESTSISERHFHKESPPERKSSKQTLQKTCHVRVYAFSTHPMNSLHMPLSNPTINSTVLIDKIPQQNKTDSDFRSTRKNCFHDHYFFYLQTLSADKKIIKNDQKMIKTRIFVLFCFFFFAEENTSTRLSHQQPLSVSQVTENDFR